jgi:glutamate-1-semialdehyde 2,1-aminomutase
MAAGLAMLQAINADETLFERLDQKTTYLENGMRAVLTKNNIPFSINKIGSMISVHFNEKPVIDFDSAKNGDNQFFKKFFHGLLANGIYIAPSAYESWFITDALSYQDIDDTIAAVDKVTQEF